MRAYLQRSNKKTPFLIKVLINKLTKFFGIRGYNKQYATKKIKARTKPPGPSLFTLHSSPSSVPLTACSRSIASNSALKFPFPNDLAPARWMIS